MGALTRIASLAVLLAAWQIAALEAGSRLLPAPLAVLRFIVQEAERGDLAHNVGMTLLRVAISFTVARAFFCNTRRMARSFSSSEKEPPAFSSFFTDFAIRNSYFILDKSR